MKITIHKCLNSKKLDGNKINDGFGRNSKTFTIHLILINATENWTLNTFSGFNFD